MNVLRLPKWAQDMIGKLRTDKERLQRQLTRNEEKTVKQSGDLQALLDIVRNLRPDLFDRWSNGTSLEELIEASKQDMDSTVLNDLIEESKQGRSTEKV
mgnify:CR=1 FL=1